MEKSKYYTPDITEFCVGFEYETNYLKKDWEKQILKLEDIAHFFDSYILDASALEFRVKHLDEQDILDLGWTKTEDKCSYTGRNYFKIVREDGFNTGVVYKIVLYQNGSLHYMWESYSSYATDKGQIIINIKNKTEFKKLMQQLRINHGV